MGNGIAFNLSARRVSKNLQPFEKLLQVSKEHFMNALIFFRATSYITQRREDRVTQTETKEKVYIGKLSNGTILEEPLKLSFQII